MCSKLFLLAEIILIIKLYDILNCDVDHILFSTHRHLISDLDTFKTNFKKLFDKYDVYSSSFEKLTEMAESEDYLLIKK